MGLSSIYMSLALSLVLPFGVEDPKARKTDTSFPKPKKQFFYLVQSVPSFLRAVHIHPWVEKKVTVQVTQARSQSFWTEEF